MALNVLHTPTRHAGFWGESTATLDWCEENYHHTPYIAEFCNHPPIIISVNHSQTNIRAHFAPLSL
jgi:hypothetical protein